MKAIKWTAGPQYSLEAGKLEPGLIVQVGPELEAVAASWVEDGFAEWHEPHRADPGNANKRGKKHPEEE